MILSTFKNISWNQFIVWLWVINRWTLNKSPIYQTIKLMCVPFLLSTHQIVSDKTDMEADSWFFHLTVSFPIWMVVISQHSSQNDMLLISVFQILPKYLLIYKKLYKEKTIITLTAFKMLDFCRNDNWMQKLYIVGNTGSL